MAHKRSVLLIILGFIQQHDSRGKFSLKHIIATWCISFIMHDQWSWAAVYEREWIAVISLSCFGQNKTDPPPCKLILKSPYTALSTELLKMRPLICYFAGYQTSSDLQKRLHSNSQLEWFVVKIFNRQSGHFIFSTSFLSIFAWSSI
jgi:hypothetical protein